jgi:excisionase family DNA binding protein
MGTHNNALLTGKAASFPLAQPNSLLTETEVAAILSVTVSALRRWRFESRGPKFTKVGKLVRYRREDVESWLNKQPAGGAVQ